MGGATGLVRDVTTEYAAIPKNNVHAHGLKSCGATLTVEKKFNTLPTSRSQLGDRI